MATATIKESGILLEAGTNEAEILVFQVGEQYFGVNVAKVKEVLEIGEVTAVPHGHPAIEGLAQIRNEVVTLVNLAQYLYGDEVFPQTNGGKDYLLLLEFNSQQLAFRVQRIQRIYRVSWTATRPLPEAPGMTAPVTSVILLDGRLIQILDFETIGNRIGQIDQASSVQDHHVERIEAADCPIVFAEDSRMISEMIQDSLHAAGFSNVRGFTDGEDALRYLQMLAAEHDASTIRSAVSVVVTDVEMPRMDGFSLAKRIRSNERLAQLPIVIFSSLVSRDNEKKGRQVGVSCQVAKPRYEELVLRIREAAGIL
ncbi:chemotaxis protein [Blastopirellula sp. JC732]|uniref:Chemotaxis protein n=1 Tax=Blastopirellula sediminis TaxID=2894196 RepID=A0A9X1MJR5_9BACT|nr:chemotaxis protein [Blastopirellula sediminis]MCC9609649.1 chemotaxis protein [Blastopirellula sediminis]MCC9627575.1 chemotaxis protein [Blastopirellula sediminis]